jgi:hypothetical protein
MWTNRPKRLRMRYFRNFYFAPMRGIPKGRGSRLLQVRCPLPQPDYAGPQKVPVRRREPTVERQLLYLHGCVVVPQRWTVLIQGIARTDISHRSR